MLTIHTALSKLTARVHQIAVACNHASSNALSALCRSLAACAASFQRHKLPLHGLINNVGAESPEDEKSADGFDV